jgi:hypothetical protein
LTLPAPLGKSKTTKTSETPLEQRVADVADVLKFSAKMAKAGVDTRALQAYLGHRER